MERQRARIEGELLPLAEPSGNCRLEPPGHRFAHIEEHDAGTPKQPLETAGDEPIHARFLHIDRNLTDGLIRIDEAEGAMRVSGFRNRLDILNRAAREVHV